MLGKVSGDRGIYYLLRESLNTQFGKNSFELQEGDVSDKETRRFILMFWE